MVIDQRPPSGRQRTPLKACFTRSSPTIRDISQKVCSVPQIAPNSVQSCEAKRMLYRCFSLEAQRNCSTSSTERASIPVTGWQPSRQLFKKLATICRKAADCESSKLVLEQADWRRTCCP